MVVHEALTYGKMSIYNNDLCMPFRYNLEKNIFLIFLFEFYFFN